MARSIHKLTDTKIRADLREGRHSDGGGLYLNVKPGGSKSWIFMFHRGGKRRVAGLGPYPEIKLAIARQRAAQWREKVELGIDPIEERRQEAAPTFGRCAELFLDTMEGQWRNDKHRAQWRMTLGPAYCATIFDKPIDDISTDDVLSILNPVWSTKHETASRLRGRIERVLDYAKSRGWRTGENPALWRGHLKNLLPARKKLQRGHHAAMPYSELPDFMSRLAIHDAMAARCLAFLVFTASRSGEVRDATWAEIDLEAAVWTIPAKRMKAGRLHRVPLSSGAMAVLKPLYGLRRGEHVFPGQKDGRPLSAMAMEMLMRRMNVAQFTVHGFRSAFRDWAGDETDFSREVAEAALAHVSGDQTEQAYRRADALEKRRKLMEAWSRYVSREQLG